jgi:tetratricopeptide (TPR) repeat protein
MHRRILLLCAIVTLWAAGCVSRYTRALERGDYFAQAGDWDAAAASYERATRLDPERPEAALRLQQARRHQVARRMAAVRKHLDRGEIEVALDVADEAVRIDPGNQEARAVQQATRAAVLRRGEELFSTGRVREALDLALRLRRSRPADPEATALEARARDQLAAEAYAHAERSLMQGQRGNALLALLSAEQVRPGYRDAAARAAAVRREIEGELQYHIVVERTRGEPRDMAEAVDRELSDKLRDPGHPLLTIDKRAPAPDAVGMTVALRLEGYATWDTPTSVVRTCKYVCGIDRLPNPAFPAATRAADMAGARARDADADVRRARSEVDQKRRPRDALKVEEDLAERNLSRARHDLDACKAAPPPPGKPTVDQERCRRHEHEQRAAEQAHEAARSRVKIAEADLNIAEDRARRAEGDLNHRQSEWQRELERLGRTPQILEVERVCTDSYPVTTHTAQATVGLLMRAGLLGGEPARDLPNVPYNVTERDETFEARPGRCAVTAAGDPLTLPSEAQMRQSLAARVVEGVRGSVHGSYEAYREEFLAEERRERAAGREAHATEARVRWLLLGPDASKELGFP